MKIFVGGHCGPCQGLKQLLEQGQFVLNKGTDLELVDVESPEGFEEMQALGLVKAVPSAFLEGQQCRISVDETEKVVYIDCPD